MPPEILSSLLDAIAAVNSAEGLDGTLGAIARAAAAVVRAEGSSVILLDRVRRKQVFRAAVGDRADQLIGLDYPAGAGLSGEAMGARQVRVYPDVAKEKAHLKEIDVRLAFQTRSLIAAPLICNDEVLGVVEVVNPIAGGQFNANDGQLAEIFANLAAIAVSKAQHLDRMDRENRGLKETLGRPGRMVGDSAAMRKVFDLIRRVAASNTTVLLLGESGVGKELAARMIHHNSPRDDGPFIPVNCAALPETLLESELFGHEAGSFTGATRRRLGRFELAEQGTIFLDEIGDVTPATQVKLLRVLQEKEFVRIGGTQAIGCDVRVIAATNRDLGAETARGRFRDDLYYRLNVFPITIPPLRDRREDICALVEHFLEVLSAELKMKAPRITDRAMEAMARHDYPGNIRELRNILERACLLGAPEVIDAGDLPPAIVAGTEAGGPAQTGLEDAATPTAASRLAAAEKGLILEALRESNGNQTRAAARLGITRDCLRYRMRKHGIARPK